MQANNADSVTVVAIINTLLNVLVSTATYVAANMTNALEAANNCKSLEHARAAHHHAMQEVNNHGSTAYVRCSTWMKRAGTKTQDVAAAALAFIAAASTPVTLTTL